jgi:hypothetical protein
MQVPPEQPWAWEGSVVGRGALCGICRHGRGSANAGGAGGKGPGTPAKGSAVPGAMREAGRAGKGRGHLPSGAPSGGQREGGKGPGTPDKAPA